MKIKQIKQNTEANYQTIHGTGIEPRKPLRVAFSQVAKVNIFCEACYHFFIYFYLKADSVTSGGGVQEDIKEEDEEEEEDEKKDDVFEPDKKLIGQGKKAEPSTPPGT